MRLRVAGLARSFVALCLACAAVACSESSGGDGDTDASGAFAGGTATGGAGASGAPAPAGTGGNVAPDAGGAPAPDAGRDASAAGSDAADAGDPLDAASDAGSPPPDAGDAQVTADGPNVDRSDPRLHELTLDPAALDPAASDFIADQFAQLDTRAEPLGKLVLFLPGANNSPADWRNHGQKLAEFGFHVVIPHYNNSWGSACSGQGPSCNADTRWEALTGEDVSPVIDVSRADSAEGRVLAMLEHLREADPGGDWGYYLNADGTLRDAEVIIAGISHGASSTGLFASRRAFFRAVMHSGGWGQPGDDPATPMARHYALSHTDDPQHAAHLSSWESAGMLGEPTSIDGQSPPFGDAHRLITSEPNVYPHCSVAVHSSSPENPDGSYMFEPAWRHMYGVAELSP